jgi:hypothetical protein
MVTESLLPNFFCRVSCDIYFFVSYIVEWKYLHQQDQTESCSHPHSPFSNANHDRYSPESRSSIWSSVGLTLSTLSTLSHTPHIFIVTVNDVEINGNRFYFISNKIKTTKIFTFVNPQFLCIFYSPPSNFATDSQICRYIKSLIFRNLKTFFSHYVYHY